MSVFLATDDVTLYPSGDPDEHGWMRPAGNSVSWVGRAAVQLDPGLSGADASEEGGAGPHQPATTRLGNVFLPADAGAAEGMVLLARGERYVLSRLRLIPDPTGGSAGCVVATLTQLELVDATEQEVT